MMSLHVTNPKILKVKARELLQILNDLSTAPNLRSLRCDLGLTEIYEKLLDQNRSTRFIIAYTEIRVERLRSDAGVESAAYSCTTFHTVKFLIATTLVGTIAFTSQGYGGKAFDDFITTDCGFLNMVNPGEVVLADLGFSTSPEWFKTNIRMRAPPRNVDAFAQYEGEQQTNGEKLSQVRIRVERAIGAIKQFELLAGTLPYNLLNLAASLFAGAVMTD